jgi:plasmid stability protein
VTTLVVDGLDPALVARLHRRAAREGVSEKELHRRILVEALAESEAGEEAPAGGRPATTRDLIDVLREMGRLGLRVDMEDRGEGPDRAPLEM